MVLFPTCLAPPQHETSSVWPVIKRRTTCCMRKSSQPLKETKWSHKVRRRGSGEVLTVEMEPTFFSGRPAPKWKGWGEIWNRDVGWPEALEPSLKPCASPIFPFSFAFSLQRISAQILCFCVIVFFFWGFSLLLNPRSGWTPESEDARLVACFFPGSENFFSPDMVKVLERPWCVCVCGCGMA